MTMWSSFIGKFAYKDYHKKIWIFYDFSINFDEFLTFKVIPGIERLEFF
jgi:hypothetical protein